jgi:glycosyltransferase involved in cell wall biosynthesis
MMALTIDILLWAGVVIWTGFLVLGLINAVLVRDIARVNAPDPGKWPFVSYVVPARNEEANIANAVTSFCSQDYPSFEVVVVNDRSTDGTGRVLKELQARYSNLVVVEGEDPPSGWLGKPNALEIGRRRAKGDWILMNDADVVHAPDLLRRAVAYSLQEQAGMLVIRPRHVTGGVLEAVLMCGVNFFFFVATPAFLVRYSRSPLFSTGSPVFNLMRRDALEACGGFGCLKQAVVDDLEIGFKIKQAGYRVAVAFSGMLIGHRMYPGARETVKGFGKTTYPTIRKVPWLLPIYYALGLVASFLPYYGLARGMVGSEVSSLGLQLGWLNVPAAISLLLMHLVFAGIAWRYREPWYITFLNPLRELGWFWIFTRSFVLYCRNGLVWRGRSYAQTS